MEHETQDKIFLLEVVEENEKLGSSGNDIDEVIAMLRGIPISIESSNIDLIKITIILYIIIMF